MNSSSQRWLRACLRAGTLASVLSGVVIMGRAKRDKRDAASGLNAPSHWVWGDRALRARGTTARYTATGALVHHASSLFWSGVHAALCQRAGAPRVATAFAIAGLAAWVDLRLVPHRLTPGFQHLLGRGSLVAVYAAFGLGLAWGAERERRLPCGDSTSPADG